MGEGGRGKVQLLTFNIPFWQKRHYYTCPFHIPTLEHCTPFSALERTILREIIMTSILPEEMLSKRQVLFIQFTTLLMPK